MIKLANGDVVSFKIRKLKHTVLLSKLEFWILKKGGEVKTRISKAGVTRALLK